MQSEASHNDIWRFFAKPHPAKKDMLRWRMVATMRRLFMVDPPYAEVTFAGEQYQNKIRMEWIAAGKLGPLDTYNLIRHCPWGEIRRTTFYVREGEARSWHGSFPEREKGHVTIEVDEKSMVDQKFLQTSLAQLAEWLPNRDKSLIANCLKAVAGSYSFQPQMQDVFSGMSLFSAVSQAGESELLMDFLDTGLQAGLIAKKEDLLSHMQWFLKQKTEAYEQCLFPGLAFSKILLMAKIFAVSYPELKLPESAHPKSAYVALPFGSYMSHLRFVCGRYDCRHAMCEYRRREILSETGLPAGVDGTLLAHRDFAAYCGSNRISMIVLLQSVHSHKQGRQFIQKAADELRVEGESLRDALLDAKSVSEFYHLHYQLIPYFQAATIAYTFLGKTAEAPQHPGSLEDSADADDEKEAMRLQANRCEEFMARSGGALCCDLANAIDLASLREARATIAWLKEESKSKFQPHNYLNKVLRDERWYPSFWRDFLLGESATIPISLKRDYRWQRLVSRFHQTWPPRSH